MTEWDSNPRSQRSRAKTVHALDRAATVIGRVDDRALKMYELNCGRCIKVLLASLTRKLHMLLGMTFCTLC
jgi:hypothetical protein